MKQFVFLFFGLYLFGCQQDSVIGDDFFAEKSFETSVIDTLTLITSTIVYDSFQTNGLGRLLIGRSDDEVVGQIESHAIFQVGLGSTASYLLDEDNVRYDSLVLRFLSDDYFYNNPEESRMAVEVRQIREELEGEENGRFYNTSFRKLDQYLSEENIGRLNFRSSEERFDSLLIRLDDSLGLALFDKVLEEDDALQDDSEFLDFIKGFLLSPIGNNTPFLGLSLDVELRLYYSDFTDAPIVTDEYLSFPLENRIYFNRISHNRQGTNFEPLLTLEEPISSDETDNILLMNGGAGTAVRVEIPFLKDLTFDDDDFLIAAATLEIPVIEDTYGDETELVESLESVFVDDDNLENFNVLMSDARLLRDEDFQRDTKYEMDVLNFINTQLSIVEKNENALVLRLPFPDMNTTVHRALLGDQTRGMKLRIHTISNNND